MRKKNFNQNITRDDVKPGDRIRITREVTVRKVRPTNLAGAGPSVILEVDGPAGSIPESLALTRKEAVTLLERDLSLDFGEDAKVVSWNTTTTTHYALAVDGGGWVSSDEDTYEDAEELEADILNGAFGEYVEGTFKVIHPAPGSKFSQGGYINSVALSEGSRDFLSKLASTDLSIASARPRLGQ